MAAIAPVRKTLAFLLVPLTLLALLAALALWLAARPEALRAAVVALVERESGARLLVRGPVDVELWPQPAVSLARIELVREGGLRLRADRLDAALDLMSLLRLSPQPERLRLVRPEIELALAPTALVRALAAPAAPLEVELLEGRIRWRRGGLALALAGAELRLGRDSTGRVEAQLTARLGNRPLALTLAGRSRGRRLQLRLDLALGEGQRVDALRFEGELVAARTLRAEGLLRVQLAAPRELAAAFGRTPRASLMAALPPLGLEGRLRYDDAGMVLEPARLDLGSARLRGRIAWRPQAAVAWDVRLEAERLVLADGALWAWAERLRRLPTRAELRLTAGSGELDGLGWQRLRLEARLGGSTLTIRRLSAAVGDGGTLTARGQLDADGGFALEADLALDGKALSKIAALPPLPPALRAGQWLLQVRCEGQAAGLRCPRLDLRTPVGRFAGSLDRPRGGRLVVRGRIDRLVLDPLTELATPAWRRALVELSRRLPLRLLLTVERLAFGRLLARGLELIGDLEDGRVALTLERIADLAGGEGRARLQADLMGGERTLELALQLPAPGRLWRMWDDEVPPWLVAFRTLRLTLALREGPRGRRWQLEVADPALRLALQAAPTASDETLRTLTLQVTDPRRLLRRLGVPLVDARLPERLRLQLEERLRQDRRVRLGGLLELGRARFRLELADDGAGGLRGRLEGPGLPPPAQLQPLARALLRAFGPAPTAPADTPGPRAAPGLPVAQLRPLALDLSLALGEELRGRLRARDGRWRLAPLVLTRPGVRLEGEVLLDLTAALPRLALQLAGEAEEVADLLLLAPFGRLVEGPVGVEAALTARGVVPERWPETLTGRLVLRLERVVLRDVAPDPGQGLRLSPGERLPLPPVRLELAVRAGRAETTAPATLFLGGRRLALELVLDLVRGRARLVITPAGGLPLVLGDQD